MMVWAAVVAVVVLDQSVVIVDWTVVVDQIAAAVVAVD